MTPSGYKLTFGTSRNKDELMDTAYEVAKNIRGALSREGWTQARAAQALSMSPVSFRHRMNGRYSFTIAEVQTLADALGVSYSSLVELPERKAQ